MGTRLALVAVFVSAAAVCCAATADNSSDPSASDPPGVGIKVSLRPSVAIVVGIFTMIFSLTFLLLMYAKFCHPSSSSASSSQPPATAAVAPQQQGVAKPLIESLPFFRFATLRGARQGMECAVCLAPFEDADLLRLLPRCRHAFHLGCVDRWLESNASCPLCRAPVDADDARLGLKYAASARIVFGGGDDQDDDVTIAAAGSGRDLLDIYVERVPSSRFPAAHQHRQVEEEQQLDRHRHRIIVSDVVFKSRWSELVNSADLIALDADMLCSISSFPSPDHHHHQDQTKAQEEDRKRLLGGGSSNVGRANLSSSEIVRSVSEIVSLPRLHAPARERLAEEENRRWLPIARRTARWFAAGRAKQDDEEGGVHVEAAHV